MSTTCPQCPRRGGPEAGGTGASDFQLKGFQPTSCTPARMRKGRCGPRGTTARGINAACTLASCAATTAGGAAACRPAHRTPGCLAIQSGEGKHSTEEGTPQSKAWVQACSSWPSISAERSLIAVARREGDMGHPFRKSSTGGSGEREQILTSPIRPCPSKCRRRSLLSTTPPTASNTLQSPP